jgi:hypothetical protein
MKKIIIFLVAIMTFPSCEDMLVEVPKDFVSKANYYKNEADAEGAITGAYSSLSGSYGITYWLFLVLHGDYANGRGSQAPITVFNQILDVANVGRAGRIWTDFYRTINRANAVLDNVPKIADMSNEAKSRILAEAHFMRAMSYFNLVRGFGPVPIKTTESVDISTMASPRESVDKVYELIIKDALIAEQDLPPSVGEETGRASKWAAKMLLAEVYLTLENWTEAAAKADEIINDGPFSLVPVEKADDFYNIFATETNPEDIFSLHYSESRQTSIPVFLHRPNTPPYNYGSGGYFAWLPNMDSFIGDSWDKNDLRNEFNLYSEYIGPDGDIVSLPSSSPVLFKKFITTPEGLRTYSVPLFRYTEAFFIYAEAAAMANQSPTGLALERLNIIRRRGYGYDFSATSPVDYPSGMTKEAFRDAVLKEKAYEFLLEGKRWWDLKRTGKVKEALTAAGKTFIDERFLWPIPEEEIDNNPSINQEDQNLGY